MALDKKIKSYYRDQQLDETLLHRMLAQQLPPARLSYFRFALAASILLIAVATGFVQFHRGMDPVDFTAREIAMNHNKHLAVEVATQDIDMLGQRLDKLDFSLSLPNIINLRQLVLLGGRYCSVHGQLAAQLKLKRKPDGEIVTLYITRPVSYLRNRLPVSRVVNGVRIRMWSENGLFFGMAEGMKQKPL